FRQRRSGSQRRRAHRRQTRPRPLGSRKDQVEFCSKTAPVYGGSALYNFPVNPDRTPTVRMPRIKDLSRLRTRVFDCSLVPQGGQPSGQRQSGLVSFGAGDKKELGAVQHQKRLGGLLKYYEREAP